MPFGVNGADVLARALKHVLKERLALARDGLDLSKLREVAHGADGSDLSRLFRYRLGGDEERAPQALRRILHRHGAPLCARALDDAVPAALRAEYVAAAASENLLRRERLHRSARAVDPHQSSLVREDEDAVRHRVEGNFPSALGARDQLEQLGLRYSCGELRGDRLDQSHLVLHPEPHAVCLVYAERAAEATLHDERADDLRQPAVESCHLAHMPFQFGRALVVVGRVVDDERALRLDEVATDGFVVADARGAYALAFGAGREVLVHDGRVVGASGVVGPYIDARGAKGQSEFVRRRAQHFRQVERGAYGVAQLVDEGLACGGRLSALVEFGLSDGDASLVCDGTRERDVFGAPAARVTNGGEREAAGHVVAHAYGDVHD